MEINKGIWVNAASRVLSTGQGLILRLVFYPEHHTFDQDQGDFWIILNEAAAVLFVSSQCSRNPTGDERATADCTFLLHNLSP